MTFVWLLSRWPPLKRTDFISSIGVTANTNLCTRSLWNVQTIGNNWILCQGFGRVTSIVKESFDKISETLTLYGEMEGSRLALLRPAILWTLSLLYDWNHYSPVLANIKRAQTRRLWYTIFYYTWHLTHHSSCYRSDKVFDLRRKNVLSCNISKLSVYFIA